MRRDQFFHEMHVLALVVSKIKQRGQGTGTIGKSASRVEEVAVRREARRGEVRRAGTISTGTSRRGEVRRGELRGGGTAST